MNNLRYFFMRMASNPLVHVLVLALGLAVTVIAVRTW